MRTAAPGWAIPYRPGKERECPRCGNKDIWAREPICRPCAAEQQVKEKTS